MNKNYYIFSDCRLKREGNTLFLILGETKAGKKRDKRVIPITNVENLFVFSEVDFNTKLINLIAKYGIMLHFFNYYGFYSGSFVPRETLLSGYVLVEQVKCFTNLKKQMILSKETISAASYNILKNLTYHNQRGKDVSDIKKRVEMLSDKIGLATKIDELMGIEGNIRQSYYEAFPVIINQEIEFEKRIKRPPDNMINTLISFGNSLLYTTTLSMIYKTQLNSTVSFYHKPSFRRHSLALDISEIFKPILVDRIIFRLLNRNMISEKDFEKSLNFCYMKERAKKAFLKEFDNQIKQTIRHKILKRNFSYQHLIKLECYKLIKFITEGKDYSAFRIWW